MSSSRPYEPVRARARSATLGEGSPKNRPALSDLPVVILCGGQGTRLREETEYRPKPMVEVGGQPILWHIMKIYASFGVQRFILCLGYKGWMIKHFFLRYQEQERDFTITTDGSRPIEYHGPAPSDGWRVTCAETGELAATGARLKRVRHYIDTPTFFFTYGDAVADVRLDELLDFHYRQARIGTVTGVNPTSRYGEMEVGDDGRVIEFNEKPTVAEGWVSGGFFVFQREIFDYLDDDPGLFLELDPLRKLARDEQLSVHRHTGAWHPMDTYRDYLQLEELWRSGKPPWKIWE